MSDTAPEREFEVYARLDEAAFRALVTNKVAVVRGTITWITGQNGGARMCAGTDVVHVVLTDVKWEAMTDALDVARYPILRKADRQSR
jgi:hypothetical protein